jgi:protein-disulfide isomerase
LKAQNYEKAKAELVDRLKKTYGVTVALRPWRVNVKTEGSPSLGPASAPVTMVEFSDFQCPFCSRLSDTLQQVLSKYSKEVRLVYRQFPLSQIHLNAEKAAEASRCAAEQGHFFRSKKISMKEPFSVSQAPRHSSSMSASFQERSRYRKSPRS